ncbi:MAG TPA: hypothetical protein VHT34_01575 [Clostridia bacterium]|nr:hypothetical protein [Clostridia bacterium]
MDGRIIEKKVDNLLNDLKVYIESQSLSEDELNILKEEIDRLLYECLYYKLRLVS